MSEKLPVGKTIPANVAGQFYPGDKEELTGTINYYLSQAKATDTGKNSWAYLSPHAGYRFSGPIAANTFKQIMNRGIKRVIVIAFLHNPYLQNGAIRLNGIATALSSGFESPLGEIPIDVKEVIELLKAAPFIESKPEAFAAEHSLEVQLPFVKVALPDAKVVPIIFGADHDLDQSVMLGEILAKRYSDDKETVVIASTDMSHFFTYDEAIKMDKDGLELVSKLDFNKLAEFTSRRRIEFCGIMPVLSLVHAQKILKRKSPVTLDYRNSGDTYGDKSRVVGYAAVAFPKEKGEFKQTGAKEKKESYELSKEQKKRLLEIAEKTVTTYIKTKKLPEFEIKDPLLKELGAAFVTLKIKDNLRGCIGHTEPRLPLWKCIQEMAVAASTEDPRFPAVSEQELDSLHYEITVLTPMQKIDDVSEIKVGRDGLMMEKGFNRGLLLPQVPVEWGWDRDTFLDQTANKSGLPKDAWRDGSVTIHKFQGLVFEKADLGE